MKLVPPTVKPTRKPRPNVAAFQRRRPAADDSDSALFIEEPEPGAISEVLDIESLFTPVEAPYVVPDAIVPAETGLDAANSPPRPQPIRVAERLSSARLARSFDSEPSSPVREAPRSGEGGSPSTARPQGVRPAWVAAALEGESHPPVPVRLMPGSVVHGTRYRITRWLGEGVAGVVYEAQHLDIERRVALKVLRWDNESDPAAVRQFREEARLLSCVGSEYIVEVYDFFELPDGRSLFAMEFLDGKVLRVELDEGPVEPDRVIAILRQLCKGLAVAHGAGVVHRDIKPDNIVLEPKQGRQGHVKILDFGLATVVDGQPLSVVSGTPHYMAPELIRGRAYDHRVDVYSVGCTAYEMLTGVTPFSATSPREILAAHLDAVPEPVCSVSVGSADVPKAISDIVMRCLAKEPDDRYADMLELEAALCEAQIECGYTTPWDDLPLPDVELQRRDSLLRRMPDPDGVQRRQGTPGWVFGLASFVLLVACLAIGWFASRSDTTVAAPSVQTPKPTDRALSLETSTRRFPEPSLDDQLDQLDLAATQAGPSVPEAAAQMRLRLSMTLTRLGDEYWERPGGRLFAVDYYAGALVFDQANERARERIRVREGLTVESSMPAEVPDEPATATTQTMELVPDLVVASQLPAAAAAPVVKKRQPLKKARLSPTKREKLASRRKSRVLSAGADRARVAKNFKRAEALFNEALATYRRNGDALFGLCQTYLDQRNYRRAIGFCRRAVSAFPNNTNYRVGLGDAYMKVSEHRNAAAHYRVAARQGDPRAHQRLSRVTKRGK